MEFDNIVIGSGAGGLATALCLSREGQSVLVVEQHHTLGGWSHSFTIDGQHFSPGLHYIGLLEEGESTRDLYEGLGIANDLVFFRMNKEGYEHCWIGDEHIDMPANFKNLSKKLSERFPKEKKGIEAYLKLVTNVSSQLSLIPEMSGLWDNLTIAYRTRHLGKYGLFKLKRVINWFVKDPLLQAVLNVQCADHGLPPERASFPVHCSIMNHYSSGGFYPMGGGSSIVKAMTKAIKKTGGQIRTKAFVKKILLSERKKKKTAIGIELSNGEQIFAKRVISNADPGITFKDLVGVQNLSKKLRKKINNTEYTFSSLILFLTVDMDLKKAGLDSGNIWQLSDTNLDDAFKKMSYNEIIECETFPALFIGSPTLKDPTLFDGKHHTLEVVIYIDYNLFDEFKAPQKRHSKAYHDFKALLSKKMIKGLEKVIPGISNHIVQQTLGTPLTNQHYINSTNGCIYGIEKTLKQVGPTSYTPKTEIEGLYLCGGSILFHGVIGATFSGVQTAAEILGCKQNDLIISDNNQKTRVYDAEDADSFPEDILEKIKRKQQL